jgi:uncharacterized repeat protein (TIGR03803 family)
MKLQRCSSSRPAIFKRDLLFLISISLFSWLFGGVFLPSSAQTLTTLVNFSSANGSRPISELILGSDGNFYGTTFQGGNSNAGTVFRLSPSGTLTTLLNFSGQNGANPAAKLVQGSDGNFYGTTQGGGSSSGSYGTVFRMTPSGSLTTLVNFDNTNGSAPVAPLVQGSDGNFYGTTIQGGSSNLGTVYRMTPSGALTTLVNFDSTNGSLPEAGLVQGNDGNFYSTTFQGGSFNQGTVFRITPSGSLTTLISFFFMTGTNPATELILGSDGNFYGTTQGGGSSSGGYGTVFRMTPSGSLTTLVNFDNANGGFPVAPLVQGSDGNFYGTTRSGGTSNAGTLFKTTPFGTLTTLVSFVAPNGSSSINTGPYAGLIQGSDGNFYGTTLDGGSNNSNMCPGGCGTVFQLNVGLSPLHSGLSYYPLSPCRIIDTRNTGTNLPINTPVAFKINSNGSSGSYSSQGGNASGCGIPTDAKAIFFNFVAVNAVGSGFLQAWPFGSSIPTASVLNYVNAPGLNIANGIVLPVCDPSIATCTNDLNIQANQSSTQLVVDAVGYFK